MTTQVKYKPEEVSGLYRSGKLPDDQKALYENNIDEFVKQHVEGGTQEKQPVAPEETPVKPEDVPSKKWTPEEFIRAVSDAGFTYKNPYEAVEGLKHANQAVKRYRDDAFQTRQSLEELQKKIKDLEEKPKERPKEEPKTPPAEEHVFDIPAKPEYKGEDLEEETRKLNEYTDVLRAQLAKAHEYSRDAVGRVEKDLQDKIVDITKKYDQAINEIKEVRGTVESNRTADELRRRVDNAQAAARIFLDQHKDTYKLSNPVEVVGSEYRDLHKTVESILKTDPPTAAAYENPETFIREVIKGNPHAVQKAGTENIHIGDDLKTYQLLVDLEAHALNSSFVDKNGRPDLVRALADQEYVSGISKQRIVDERVAAYDDAQRIHKTYADTPQVPPKTPPGPTDDKPPTAEEVAQLVSQLTAISQKGGSPQAIAEAKKPILERLARHNVFQT